MYEIKPMHQHYDGGLGATGEAFKEAADRLSESISGSRFFSPGKHPYLLPLPTRYRTLSEVHDCRSSPPSPSTVDRG
jgi:hypothetical protein